MGRCAGRRFFARGCEWAAWSALLQQAGSPGACRYGTQISQAIVCSLHACRISQSFISGCLNGAEAANPGSKPFAGGTCVQSIPHGPIYLAGFAGYITLDRMNTISPSTKAEAAKSGWIFCFAFITPFVLMLTTWWSVYFTAEAHLLATAIATILSIPVTYLTFRRTSRLMALGLHPHYRSGVRVPLKHKRFTYLGLWAILFAWTLALTGMSIRMAGPSTTERSFVVSQTEVCTRKCLGCSNQVALTDWNGYPSARLCVDGVAPQLRAGDRLVVRGHFSEFVIFIRGLRGDAG